MDKLERAVEKARQDRQASMAGLGAPKPGAPERYPVDRIDGAVPPAAVSKPKIIKEQEKYLEGSRVVAHRMRHKDADTFRILRTQVLQKMARGDHRSLAITSPHYGDGKTTVALNLALSIAQDVKQTVLLVDLDLRDPDVHNYAGLKSTQGLTDHLIHDVPLAQCMVPTPFERFSILPAGRTLDNSSEVLGSPQMALLAHELEGDADRLIIYDMPPLLDQDDSMVFFPHVGAVLLVVRDGVTRRDDVKRSIAALADVDLIGTVLNRSLS